MDQTFSVTRQVEQVVLEGDSSSVEVEQTFPMNRQVLLDGNSSAPEEVEQTFPVARQLVLEQAILEGDSATIHAKPLSVVLLTMLVWHAKTLSVVLLALRLLCLPRDPESRWWSLVYLLNVLSVFH